MNTIIFQLIKLQRQYKKEQKLWILNMRTRLRTA